MSSYEFMSRVRVGYNIEKKLDAPPVPPPSRNITLKHLTI